MECADSDQASLSICSSLGQNGAPNVAPTTPRQNTRSLRKFQGPTTNDHNSWPTPSRPYRPPPETVRRPITSRHLPSRWPGRTRRLPCLRARNARPVQCPPLSSPVLSMVFHVMDVSNRCQHLGRPSPRPSVACKLLPLPSTKHSHQCSPTAFIMPGTSCLLSYCRPAQRILEPHIAMVTEPFPSLFGRDTKHVDGFGHHHLLWHSTIELIFSHSF